MSAMQCTAHNRNGNQCKRSAIIGGEVCRLHGGSAPQVVAAAGRRHTQALADREAAKAVALWGGRLDVQPAQALLELVQDKAAEVMYWKLRVSELTEDEMTWGTTKHEFGLGQQGPIDTETREAELNLALDTLHKAQRQLAEMSAMSLKAGVEERTIALAEDQANKLLAVIRTVVADHRLAVTASEPVVTTVITDALKTVMAIEAVA